MRANGWTRAAAGLCGALALASSAGGAGEAALTVSAQVASDYVLRGVSQSARAPVFQAGVEVEHPGGLFAGAWASTVDFSGARYFADPRDVELDLYAGYGLELARDWSLVSSVVRYTYPWSDTQFDYNYTELGCALQYRRAAFAGTYTSNAFGTEQTGVTWELSGTLPLPRGFELGAGAGLYFLRAIDDNYRYWHLSLSRLWRRTTLRLGYYGSGGVARRYWGDAAGARVVVGASVGLWRLNPIRPRRDSGARAKG
jgi:uncharacterized protein (TIGR02001 family)